MDADAWDERYAASELVWSAAPNRFVEAECADLPPGRAVDLAAGEGRNAIWLAAEGWRVTAIDFSAVAVDRARDLAKETAERLQRDLDITWRVEDVTTAEVERSAFDAVLLSYLQLPSYERRDALRLAARALAPGGDMLILAHDTTNLTEGYGGPQDPEVLYSAADVEEDLQDYLSSGALVHERSGRVAREITDEEGVTHYAWDLLVHGKGRDMHKGEVNFA